MQVVSHSKIEVKQDVFGVLNQLVLLHVIVHVILDFLIIFLGKQVRDISGIEKIIDVFKE